MNDAHPEQEKPIFDDDMVEAIAATISVSDPRRIRYLQRRLEDLPDSAKSLRTHKLAATPSAILKELGPLERACRTLVDFLSMETDATEHPDLDARQTAHRLIRWHVVTQIDATRVGRYIESGMGNAMLADHAAAIDRVLEACERTRRAMEERITREDVKARHKADWPLEQILMLLFDFYFEVTGKKPKASLEGPTSRFLSECLPRLGWPPRSWDGYRQLIRKHAPGWRHRGG